MSKNDIFVATRCVFQALIYAQKLPRTLLGELTTLPGPSSRLGGRPLDVSTSATRLSGPQHKFLATSIAYPIYWPIAGLPSQKNLAPPPLLNSD